MKHLKNVLISLFTAFVTMFVVYGGYSTFAEYILDETKAFEDSSLFFIDTKWHYHNAMDLYFNDKFERFYDLLEEEKDFFARGSEERKSLTPPTDEDINGCEAISIPNCTDGEDNDEDGKTDGADSECLDESEPPKVNEYFAENGEDRLSCLLDKCGEDNLSPYCVSLGALDLHLRYLKVLDELQEGIPDTNDVDCFYRQTIPVIGILPTCASTASLENLLGFSVERNEAILAEYDASRQIMEVAVAAYNEFMLAYPMHKKYEETLTELTKYKEALNSIKYKAMILPKKFIGTSTYSCS